MNPGSYKGTIKKNSIRITNTGTSYVLLNTDVEGIEFPISIWLTDKAAGMARQQLKSCEFDVDSEDLLTLATDPTFLSGRVVPVEVFEEEYNGKLQTKARIPVAGTDVPLQKIIELQKLLRGAKKNHEAPARQSEDEDVPF